MSDWRTHLQGLEPEEREFWIKRLQENFLPHERPAAAERIAKMTPQEREFGADMPSVAEQQRSIELSEMRRFREAQEALAREMRLARETPIQHGYGRPSGPEWTAIVHAYQETRIVRPTQERVAEQMGIVERTLATRLRGLGVASWHDVHALVASES